MFSTLLKNLKKTAILPISVACNLLISSCGGNAGLAVDVYAFDYEKNYIYTGKKTEPKNTVPMPVDAKKWILLDLQSWDAVRNACGQ